MERIDFETSRQALSNLRNSGKLGPLQEQVYEMFYEFPDSTDLMISENSGLNINVVTARRFELVEMGLLKCTGTKLNPGTGNFGKTYAPGKEEQKQDGLSHTRFEGVLKAIKEANEFQKRKFYEQLCRELNLP